MRALVLALLPLPALADGGVTVALPDVSWLGTAQSRELLSATVLATVVGQNCTGFLSTDGEWALLTGTSDALAYGNLGLDVEAYDRDFYGPAFAALDDPATCGREGPRVAGLLRLLVDMGGATAP